MSSAPPPTADEIARDARWLVQAMDPASRMVRLIGMDREAYRAASFLDDRILQTPQDVRYASWDIVGDAASKAQRSDARWIFHIGHVGSTLIARMLGELPGVLSIREPRLLRDIASTGNRAAFTDAVAPLFSRTFTDAETALVKGTSFVSEIAAELVPADGRAVFMYATAPRYIASILTGDASRQELAALAGARAERMMERVPGLDRMGRSEAHLAAAAWACEMTALEQAAELIPNIHWLDFDAALASLSQALDEVARFFGFAADAVELQAIANGPLIKRYSKALEYEYSPDLRRELIAEATAEHRADISDSLAMLHDAAHSSPLLARVLSRSTTEA